MELEEESDGNSKRVERDLTRLTQPEGEKAQSFILLALFSLYLSLQSKALSRSPMALCIKVLKWTIGLATVSSEEREKKEEGIDQSQQEELPSTSLSTPTPTFSLLPPSPAHQVAGAGAVAGITAVKLQKVSVDASGVSLGAQCYLWDAANQANPNQACIYAYTVAGISVAAALALSILQCFTCNLCGLGDWADALFEGAAAAWWGELRDYVFWFLFFSFPSSSRVFFPSLPPPSPKGSLFFFFFFSFFFFFFFFFFLFFSLDNVSSTLQASLQVRERASSPSLTKREKERKKDFLVPFNEGKVGIGLSLSFSYLSFKSSQASSPSTARVPTPRACPRRSGASMYCGRASALVRRLRPAACSLCAGAFSSAAAEGNGDFEVDIRICNSMLFFFNSRRSGRRRKRSRSRFLPSRGQRASREERKSTVLVSLLALPFFLSPSSSSFYSKLSQSTMATVARSAACTGVARFAAPGENGKDERALEGEERVCRKK